MTSFSTDDQVQVSINLDYANSRVEALMVHSNVNLSTSDLAKYKFHVLSAAGYPICNKAGFSKVADFNGTYTAKGTTSFGISAASQGSIVDDTSRLYYAFGPHVFFPLAIDQFSQDLPYPKSNGIIPSNVPIEITDGDSVFYGRVESTTGNRIYFTGYSSSIIDNYAAAYTKDFTDDIFYVWSGNGEGSYHKIISDSTNTNNFYIDGLASTYSGAYFKILPYRLSTTYSGYSNDTYVVGTIGVDSALNTGLGSYGIETVTLNEHLPATDDYGFIQITYPGLTAGEYSLYGQASSKFNVPKDSWGRTPEVGDIVQYRGASTPSVRDQLGLIYRVEELSASAWTVFVYPSGTPSNLFGFTDGVLYKHNQYTIKTYPQFGEQHLGIVSNLTGSSETSRTARAVHSFQAPTASVEISPNEYTSIYGSISERVFFHVGPIHLSNGQILDNREIQYNLLYWDGDSTKTNQTTTWVGYSTSLPNAAEQYNGNHYRLGTYVASDSQSFNSAETVYLQATIRYGAAVLFKTAVLPVQPNS